MIIRHFKHSIYAILFLGFTCGQIVARDQSIEQENSTTQSEAAANQKKQSSFSPGQRRALLAAEITTAGLIGWSMIRCFNKLNEAEVSEQDCLYIINGVNQVNIKKAFEIIKSNNRLGRQQDSAYNWLFFFYPALLLGIDYTASKAGLHDSVLNMTYNGIKNVGTKVQNAARNADLWVKNKMAKKTLTKEIK